MAKDEATLEHAFGGFPRERLAARLDLAVSESASRSFFTTCCRANCSPDDPTNRSGCCSLCALSSHPLQDALQGLPDAWQREHRRRRQDHDEPNGDSDLHPLSGYQAGPYAER